MNKNKFLIGAITASVVATAVVPVAEASVGTVGVKNPFTDVNPSNTHFEAIEYVKDRGIIVGHLDGSFRPGEPVKREHVALMLARAFGADENKVYPDSGFTDVSDNYKWAVDFLVSEGVVHGKSPTKFGGSDFTTRAQMAKMIAGIYNLQADSDKEFKFTDVSSSFEPYVKALSDNGVTVGVSDTKYGSNDFVTRGQFASFLHRSETLVEYIGLDVEKVTVNNAREFTVKYNKEVVADSILSKEGITIKVGNKIITDYDVELVDGTDVVFTLSDDDKLVNGVALSLEISGGVSAVEDEKSIVNSYKDTFVFEDKTAPVIKDVVKDGNDILVIFDEYIDTVEYIKINGYSVSVPPVGKESSKTLIIKNGIDNLLEGTHDVVLSGISDISGNKSGVLTGKLTIEKDLELPKVSKVTQLSDYTFEIEFDKDVTFVGEGKIKVEKNGFQLKSSVKNGKDSKSFIVTLVDDGSLTVYGKDELKSNIDIKVNGFKGINNGEIGKEFNFGLTLDKDKTAPVITKDSSVVNKGSELDKNEVFNIVFDEEVDLLGLKEDLVVTNSDGIKLVVTSVTLVGDKNNVKNTVQVEVDSIKNPNGTIKLGKYNIELPAKFVSDKSGNFSGIYNQKFNVTNSDGTFDKLSAVVTASNNIINIVYNSEMGLEAIDINNYKLDGFDFVPGSKIYFDGDKRNVVIELGKESIKETGGAVVTLGDNIADLKGNFIDDGSKNLVVSTGFIDNVSPELISSEVISKNSLELTFNEVIEDSTLLGSKDFILKINDVEFNYTVSTGIADDNKIILTTVDEFNFNSNITVEVKDDGSITDKAGNKLVK